MKFTKIIALVLAVLMIVGILASCGNTDDTSSTTPTQPEVKDPVDPYAGKTHAEVSDDLYTKVLGDFNTNYQKAFAASSISERWAHMAIAEAKLLESGIFLPSTANGGNFAISRVVPYSVSPVLWGMDNYRYYKALIADLGPNKFLTPAERDELKALWKTTKGTGTYEAAAKAWLEAKGYGLKDTYTLGYTSDPQTWDAFATYRSADSEAILNSWDSLLEYNGENVQVPKLAEEMPTVSDDGLTYTFKIRQGVKWYDAQGNELGDLTAQSFVDAMHHMLDAQGGLEYLVSGVIKNAAEYMAQEITDFSQVGVKATDTYTLVYTLEAPCTYFLSMFGYNIFAPICTEQFIAKGGVFGVAEYQALVDEENTDSNYTYGQTPFDIAYCGPYLLTSYTAQNSIVWELNKNYWDKDSVNIKKIEWKFLDGENAKEGYENAKADVFAGAGLNSAALAQAKADGLFDTYAYVSAVDAASFPVFFNLYRCQYGNFNDTTVAPTTMTDNDKIRTNLAMQNHNFRLALVSAVDRGAYNATTVGDEVKLNSLVNSYTPGNFVSLEEDVTIKINGTDKTFPAGTFYGAIMQAQIDADGGKMKVWDPTLEGGVGSSTGFDGWYNVENAKAYLAAAIEELKAEGVVITAENPIILEMPYYDVSQVYTNRANALKQSVEASLEGKVKVELVKTGGSNARNWYYAGYYPESGDAMNYNIVDVCGWSPDFGDPQTYLDTMLPQAGGMAKNIGLY